MDDPAALHITPTAVVGVHVVEPERRRDERGFFARTWSAGEFARAGLDPRVAHCGLSYNPRRGTLRGMHYQAPPFTEVKLVRCTRGAVFDVAVDLRPDSPTFRRFVGVELTADNRRALYVPRGCAHGVLTLADASEVYYQISVPYHAEAARGVRWSDPFFGVDWPARVEVITPRDRDYPDVDPAALDELRGLLEP